MKVALSSDKKTHLVDTVVAWLKQHQYTVIPYGVVVSKAEKMDWPVSSTELANAVANGTAETGVLFCWTGTGASIAANKITGIRAALCHDAETAKGARIWNHANVLVLSLRATSEAIAEEILNAWFTTPFSKDDWNVQQINRIHALDK